MAIAIGTPNPRTISATTPDVDALRSRIAGEVVVAGAESYDEARQTSVLSAYGKPAVIVRAASEGDVVEAVRFARWLGRPVAVRSGGHSVAGHSTPDGEIVIDLSGLRAVSIDPARRTARVQAGARTVDVMTPAHAYGLALSTGDTRTVGLGGLTTGGGIGFMARKHGLAIDNLLSVRIVTAAGELLTASEREHADLFWGVRGGGGNFGIVTEFEFRLAQVGQVLGGALVLPASRQVLRGYLDYAADAPDGLTTIANLMYAPPAPFVPEQRVGELSLMILVCWTGDVAEGERAIAPLRALAEPIADAVAPIPYPVMYQFTAEQEAPFGIAIRSMFSEGHSDATLDAFFDAMAVAPNPFSMVQFRGMGGAVSRVAPDDTAFAHRTQRYFTSVLALWKDPAENNGQFGEWTEALWEKIRGEASGVYANFLGDEGEERVRQAYPGATYDRLAAVKRAYDPQNVFRFNQNIKPR